MNVRIATREEYLREVIARMAPWFVALEKPLPDKIRASCGWPSRGGAARSRRVIGQCFAPTCSKDGTAELFISPTVADPIEVAATVAHELAHAAVGVQHKHKGPFVRLARGLLLEGKPTQTVAGDAFRERVAPIISDLGDYPHASLDVSLGLPKQTTRMVKCMCLECGYVARTTRKWLDTVGAPVCPVPTHGEMEVAA